MTETNDFYWLTMDREDAKLRSSAAFRPIVERLDASFLPKPAKLEVTGAKDRAINGWLDAKIGKAIDDGKPSIGLVAPGIQTAIGLSDSRTSLSLFFRIGPEPAALRALFVDLCRMFKPAYGRLTLNNKGQELHDAHYARARRTFYASGLYWLNYFGPAELARQGGAALAENPHARAEWLDGGLLLEVGSDPLDALTAEGEARLLDATRSMPPVGAEATPDAATSAPAAEAAPIITVGGVRGFLDADGDFWVSKHIDPPRQVDAKTLRALTKLPGKGTPPIKRVHVLFSTFEAARANKAALEAIGAHAWFVSPEDGKRAPV
jgi:hypothetical protein